MRPSLRAFLAIFVLLWLTVTAVSAATSPIVWRRTYAVTPSPEALQSDASLKGFVPDGAGGQYLFGSYGEQKYPGNPGYGAWTNYPWVVRTDVRGRQLWSRTYPVTPVPSLKGTRWEKYNVDPYELSPVKAMPLANGGVRLLVTSGDLSSNCPFVTILDIDPAGEETNRFTVNFADSPLGYVSICEAALLPGGGVLLSGVITEDQTFYPPNYDAPLYVALAGQDGQVAWFTLAGRSQPTQRSIALNDGNLAVWAQMTAGVGNFLWRRLVFAGDGSLLSDTGVALPDSMVVTPDGGAVAPFVQANSPSGDPSLGYVVTVVKYDGEGAVQWTSSAEAKVYFYRVRANADGTFLTGGESPFWEPFFGRKVSIIKFDALGRIVWSSYYQNSNENTGVNFCFGEASDGGALYQENTTLTKLQTTSGTLRPRGPRK